MRPFAPVLLSAALLFPGSALWARQEAPDRAEILKKLDAAIQEETAKSRAALLELIRQELRGAKPAAAPEAKAAPAANTEKAKAVVTVELLKKHASFLASDDLEGRCAGYPGCEIGRAHV